MILRITEYAGERTPRVNDQYQFSTDNGSGIPSDPTRPDDPKYIVCLIGQVVRVSIETVRIVRGLPKEFR